MTDTEFERLVKAYRATVFRLAYSIVKNREDADDITQDAFVKLYRSKEIFASDENVKAWLIRVTINLSKDLLRSAWFRHRHELNDNIPCESAEEYDLLERVKQLAPEDSAVIYLFYYEGYSVEEIARMRNSTSSAVRTRLTRARKKLKAMLTSDTSDKTTFPTTHPLKEENL